MLYVISNKNNFNKDIQRNVVIKETISINNIIHFIDLNHKNKVNAIINTIITNKIDFIDMKNYEKLFISKHNISYENYIKLFEFYNNKDIKTNLLTEHEIYIKKTIRNEKINQILNKKILK